jgi:hypothetical protein
MPSVIQGITPDHRVYNVDIADVYMDGTCVSNAADGNFEIDPATTDQIRIMKSQGNSCQTPGPPQNPGA